MVKHSEDLRGILGRIDGRGYKAYKDIAGAYRFDRFHLFLDHIQGDPFAEPSRVRVRVAASTAAIPEALLATHPRRVATADCFARLVRDAIRCCVVGRRGTGKSGRVEIDAGGQEVLERTAVALTDDWIEARLQVGLPAAGRTILGAEAAAMLCEEIPAVVDAALLWSAVDGDAVKRFVGTVENYHALRDQLAGRSLCAFVADGAVLPRESGASDRPMDGSGVVPFASCPSLRATLSIPNSPDGTLGVRSELTGLGIPCGVTLVVGGGYHGKSTLLRALERGVYPHVPGDGREYVVTDPAAVKIRAEDGRRVERVDIAPFIGNLPGGRDTGAFCTDDASGSTSQAAAIVEAIQVGATTLLLDEDTCATNFMVRDSRMQALVAKEHEPITPFVDRVFEMWESWDVSTVLVMGGCGDYFEVADTVVLMREYRPFDATDEAHRIAAERPTGRALEAGSPWTAPAPRVPDPRSLDPSRGRREEKVDAEGTDAIRFGRQTIDLRAVDQIVDPAQTRAIGRLLAMARRLWMDGANMYRVLDLVDDFLDENGLDPLSPFPRPGHHPGCFARPRRFEIAAALDRLRTLRVRQE